MTRGGNAGLTLIEVLLAVAVIGIVFATVAATQISNLRVTRAASDEMHRLESAVDVFESIKRSIERQFDEYQDCPTDAPSLPEPQVDPNYEGWCSGGWARANGEHVEIEIDGSSPPPGLVEVSVTVTSDGDALDLRQYVSCMAFEGSSPSVEEPGVCRE